MYCPKCGKKLGGTEVRCPVCQTIVPSQEEFNILDNTPAEENRRTRRRMRVWTGLAMIGFLLLDIILFSMGIGRRWHGFFPPVLWFLGLAWTSAGLLFVETYRKRE
jgi:hypothetical protein